MSARIIRTFSEGKSFYEAAAWEFVHGAHEAIAARGRFTVALSGGSTPKRLFQLLTTEPFRDQVDWGRLEIFWGDERCVPPDDEQSNYHMAHEAMLAQLPIPGDHIHRMEAERSDLDAAARDYQAILTRVFPDGAAEGQPPAVDLVLLGMGPDGHTASLFPHTDALRETVRWVVPNSVPQLQTQRMTLTYPILNRAREVLFLVAGSDKAERVAEVLLGPPDPSRLPAQAIQPLEGSLVWLVDRAAAARLPASPTRENMQG
jgi:6-phosphogluconolactonase